MHHAPVGLSSPALTRIADSNFIQVIRSKTAKGMVPNFSAGGSKSLDRTEPPIGAKVMLEMYKKYNDTWLVELLYDDLVAWNSWFVDERMLGPLGLVSLGSDTIDGYTDFAPGTMQGARFESGLDNSPMYDGEFFEPNLKQDGSYKIGQMTLCRDLRHAPPGLVLFRLQSLHKLTVGRGCVGSTEVRWFMRLRRPLSPRR